MFSVVSRTNLMVSWWKNLCFVRDGLGSERKNWFSKYLVRVMRHDRDSRDISFWFN